MLLRLVDDVKSWPELEVWIASFPSRKEDIKKEYEANMRIKIPPLNIPPDNPFAEDQLDLKQSAEVLTQFIPTIREPFILAIDSP